MDTLVVGAGAMGRWLAETLPTDRLVVADTDPTTAETAAEALDADVLDADADAAATGAFDCVAVAVPIPAARAAVAAHADRLRPDGALVDVVGVMAEPVAAGREHAPDAERLSLHPLFAPERAPGRVAAVVDAAGPRTATVRRALERTGNEVFETTPATHDRAMETVQASAHAAVLAFGLAAEPVPAAFTTPVFDRLAATVETVTGNDPRVYADVQDAFDGADAVAEAARRVADWDGDRAAFERLYEEAGTPLRESASLADADGDADTDGGVPGDR
jgi:prephenate dehydrogenase